MPNILSKLKHSLSSPKNAFISIIGIYFLLVMHYFQHNVGGSGLDVPINPLGWIVVSILVGLGLVQIIKSKMFLYNNYLMWVSIACLALLIPLFYGNEAAVFSHPRLLGIFAGLAVITAIYQMNFTAQDKQKMLWLILGGMFLESIFALSQFYIFPHIESLGMNIARPSAIFFQANVAATFFTTGIFIALYLLHVQSRYKTLLLIISFTCALSVMLLQSRTAFLGGVISLIIWILVTKKLPKSWLVAIGAAIVTALTSFSVLKETLRDNNVYTDGGARVEIYTDSFATFMQKPLVGHGYGTFGRAFREYQAIAFQSDSSHQQIYNLSHPHNELLLWAVEGGVVSLIPLFAILYISGRLFRIKKALILLPLIFPVSLHLFTEFPFYHSVASYLVFLSLLGLISARGLKEKTVNFNQPKVIYALVVIAISLNSYLMITLIKGHAALTYAVRHEEIKDFVQTEYLVMSEDVERALNETLLHLAIEHNIPIGATSYLSWVKPRLANYPRARHFERQLEGFAFLQKTTEYIKTLKEAKRLFPTLDWTKYEKHLQSSAPQKE